MNFSKVKELCDKKVHLTNFGMCTRDIPFCLANPGFFTLCFYGACDDIDSDHSKIQETHEANLSKFINQLNDNKILCYFEIHDQDVKLREEEIKVMNKDGFYPSILVTKIFVDINRASFFNLTDEQAAEALIKLSKIINKMPKVYEEWKAKKEA